MARGGGDLVSRRPQKSEGECCVAVRGRNTK